MGQVVRTLSVYTDTSVFGGVFDEEFETPSRSFFGLVGTGRFSLLISDVTRQEIAFAPVNAMKRYRSLEVRSPLEVIDYEDENL